MAEAEARRANPSDVPDGPDPRLGFANDPQSQQGVGPNSPFALANPQFKQPFPVGPFSFATPPFQQGGAGGWPNAPPRLPQQSFLWPPFQQGGADGWPYAPPRLQQQQSFQWPRPPFPPYQHSSQSLPPRSPQPPNSSEMAEAEARRASPSNVPDDPGAFWDSLFAFANDPQVQQGVGPSNPFAFANPPFQQPSPVGPFSFANPPFQQGGAGGWPNAPPRLQPQQSFLLPGPSDQPSSSTSSQSSSPLSNQPPISSGTVTNENYQYLPLTRAINRGDLNAVKAFLDARPDTIKIRFLENKTTALHLACHAGQAEIVKELLSRMSPDDLLVKRGEHHTPLTAAAINGNLEIAMALVDKTPVLLGIPGKDGDIPVAIAVSANQQAMARYLYPRTPLDVLLDNNGHHGKLLLSAAIFFKMLDIALHLSQACPRLAVTRNVWISSISPVCVLASRPNLFPSGSKLGLCKRFIYSLLPSSDLETLNQPKGRIGSFILFLSKFFGIHQIYDLKKTHLQAQKLLQSVCEEASMMTYKEQSLNGVFEAFFLAVKYGNVEFVVEMIRTDPEFLRMKNSFTKQRLFHLAVEWRQEKIFSLFYGLNDNKTRLIKIVDWMGNGMLHQAGFLAPSTRLENIPGPALQLQRELQWFKEVESIVPDADTETLNQQSLRPREVFSAYHADLQKEAEKWMKDNATACSLVAALIVTVTFAAAFTVPGGTDQNSGIPLRLKDNRFMFFIISNIISFFSSCTSVLIFLGILTARYSEEDFLVSLPTKMIAGLSTLLVSIAAMLSAFSSALFTLLKDKSWIVIPVTLLASLPVLLFVRLQYPLLVQMIVSTYGKGIFDRKMKPWR